MYLIIKYQRRIVPNFLILVLKPHQTDNDVFAGSSLQVLALKQAEFPYVLQKVFGKKHHPKIGNIRVKAIAFTMD
jgi:hypothetical protein